jgi:two-component system, LuxR family, sensor kinase FixL
LGTLVLALERIAAMDLRQNVSQAASVDVPPLLEELRIIVEPSLRDADISIRWEIEDDLPLVWADRQALLQVFLNLVKNSERALEEQPRKELTVHAWREGSGVTIRFRDTGGGVAHPERLFRPFQQEAQSTGLGLYLSRAFMRSFKGDLFYEPEDGGSTFVVELSPAPRESKNDSDEQRNSNIAGRRPQFVPREPQPASTDRI